jgi:hypothetical protein
VKKTEMEHLADYTPPPPACTRYDNPSEISQLASPRTYHVTPAPAHYRTKPDYQLVTDYLQGDNQAFTEIIFRHHRTLYAVARRYGSTPADAEDILQEALLRASRYLENYRGECKLRTWLYRLVVNAAYDHSHRSYQQEFVAVDDPEFHSECAKQLSHDPLAHLADVMTVHNAVNTLPADHREAIVLVDYEGYNVEQVAQMKKTKPGTIKSRRARAKNHLKDVLSQRAS